MPPPKTILIKPLLNHATKVRHALWPAAGDVYVKKYDPATGEVHLKTRVSLEDYIRITPAEDMVKLKAYGAAMKGKKLVFVNATYAGGGVAIMRAPLVALLRAAGVDAHWHVMKPDEEAFKVTKGKFHNVLQDVAGPGVKLTSQDKAVYERWVKENVHTLSKPLGDADVIVIDDWQPSGLIPYIKGSKTRRGINPEAKIIFRNHIQSEGKLMSTPGTPQYITWQYVWEHNQVAKADAFVFHPKDEFVPDNVPNPKAVFMPATADLLDDLNRPLNTKETRAGMSFINRELAANDSQKPINTKRRYIVLIARFDPSKGMPEGMAAYARARGKMVASGLPLKRIPQLVVAGNGSIDDPDGIPMLAEVMRLRSEKYGNIKDDIKVARVPHNDIALNTLLRGSALALQPSTKEGFESRVTDAILQGVPVIGSNRGGIPLQIVEGKSGYVIDPYDTEGWATRIYELMTDNKKYRKLKQQTILTAQNHNYQFTTVPNAINWLHLSLILLSGASLEGNRRWVRDLTAPEPMHVLAG